MRTAWLAAIVSMFGCGGCSGDDDTGPIEPTYANVERVVNRSCAVSTTCHGGTGRGRASLNFERLIEDGHPVTEALVGVRSCEYNLMLRVVPGDPDTSWLTVKLEAPFDHNTGYLEFTPDPAWDAGIHPRADGNYPASTCPLVVRGDLSFGRIMPSDPGHPSRLPANEREMFRQWIMMGAPGPDGRPTPLPDAGVHMDAGPTDAGTDAGVEMDAGMDAAVEMDAGMDAAVEMDAGTDAAMGVDAGTDAGPMGTDAGIAMDAGVADAG